MDIRIAPTVNFAPVGVDHSGPSGTMPAQAGVGATGAGITGNLPVQSPPTGAELSAAVDKGNKALQTRSSALEFQIDDKSHQSVVKVVDTQTRQVIRQIPSVEFLNIAQGIDDYQAHMIHEKA